MKQASAEAQVKLGELDLGKKFTINIGKKKFKVGHVSEWCSTEISILIAKKNINLESDKPEDVIKKLKYNGSLTSKCLSIAILGNVIKVKLFHWILWRYLNWFKSSQETYNGWEAVVESLNLPFSFQSLLLLEQTNAMKMKMTKMEAELYRQELLSESKQTS